MNHGKTCCRLAAVCRRCRRLEHTWEVTKKKKKRTDFRMFFFLFFILICQYWHRRVVILSTGIVVHCAVRAEENNEESPLPRLALCMVITIVKSSPRAIHRRFSSILRFFLQYYYYYYYYSFGSRHTATHPCVARIFFRSFVWLQKALCRVYLGWLDFRRIIPFVYATFHSPLLPPRTTTHTCTRTRTCIATLHLILFESFFSVASEWSGSWHMRP